MRASIGNASIRVPVCAASTLNATSCLTVRFAAVGPIRSEIPSSSVSTCPVSFRNCRDDKTCFVCKSPVLFYLLSVTPTPSIQVNPCVPTPCGPFSTCQDRGGYPSCTCMPNYIGSPPYCRAECSINSDCTGNKACIREKCQDPCPGSCGVNALCTVIDHIPACTCPDGYTGDPFRNCYLAPMRKSFH